VAAKQPGWLSDQQCTGGQPGAVGQCANSNAHVIAGRGSPRRCEPAAAMAGTGTLTPPLFVALATYAS